MAGTLFEAAFCVDGKKTDAALIALRNMVTLYFNGLLYTLLTCSCKVTYCIVIRMSVGIIKIKYFADINQTDSIDSIMSRSGFG